MKTALSLMLAVSQLASCGAAPTYLCIARDGAISIAAGPDECHCPDHERLRAIGGDVWLRDFLLARPGESRPSRIGSRGFDTCGCLHLELAHETAPLVERARVSDELAQLAVVAADMPDWADVGSTAARRETIDSARSLALGLRAYCAPSQSTSILRL